MIRPTARLAFDIDPDVYSEELVIELKRCFLNVAPVQIRQLPALQDGAADTKECSDEAGPASDGADSEDGETVGREADEEPTAHFVPARSELELIVVLNYPYWDASVEGADANWGDILIPWLEKKLYKLNATVQGYNRTRGNGPCSLAYGRLVVSLGGVLCAFKLPSSMEFPAEIPALLDKCRSFANDGVLAGVELGRIDVPSASLAAAEGDGALTKAPDDAMGDDVDAAEDSGVVDASNDADGAAGEGADAVVTPEPPIDYRVWGVHLADGTVRDFDAEVGAWLS